MLRLLRSYGGTVAGGLLIGGCAGVGASWYQDQQQRAVEPPQGVCVVPQKAEQKVLQRKNRQRALAKV